MNVTPPSSNTLVSALSQRTESANAKPPPRSQTNAGQRESLIDSADATIVQNSGFEAKKYTRDALANNTKIINTPVLERGSLLDIRI